MNVVNVKIITNTVTVRTIYLLRIFNVYGFSVQPLDISYSGFVNIRYFNFLFQVYSCRFISILLFFLFLTSSTFFFIFVQLLFKYTIKYTILVSRGYGSCHTRDNYWHQTKQFRHQLSWLPRYHCSLWLTPWSFTHYTIRLRWPHIDNLSCSHDASPGCNIYWLLRCLSVFRNK